MSRVLRAVRRLRNAMAWTRQSAQDYLLPLRPWNIVNVQAAVEKNSEFEPAPSLMAHTLARQGKGS